MHSENDDVWASDEDTSEYDKIMSLKEWDRMNENFGNVFIIKKKFFFLSLPLNFAINHILIIKYNI
jgi:hypothetical protein